MHFQGLRSISKALCTRQNFFIESLLGQPFPPLEMPFVRLATVFLNQPKCGEKYGDRPRSLMEHSFLRCLINVHDLPGGGGRGLCGPRADIRAS